MLHLLDGVRQLIGANRGGISKEILLSDSALGLKSISAARSFATNPRPTKRAAARGKTAGNRKDFLTGNRASSDRSARVLKWVVLRVIFTRTLSDKGKGEQEGLAVASIARDVA